MKLNKLIVAALVVATMWSCQKEDVDSNFVNPEETGVTTITRNFMGQDLQFEVVDEETLLLGDQRILMSQTLPEGQTGELNTDAPTVETKGQKLTLANIRKWTNNTVVYVIENNMPSRLRTVIQNSFDEWSTKTNVRFKQRGSESNFVTIRLNGDSCNCGSANLGMNGSRGTIQIGTGTTESVMIHEIGHTLGFIHEQNRPDRDQFITVLDQNISARGRSQYFISRSSTPLTSSVDFNSIMMYSSRTFANSSAPTMIVKATGARVQGFGRNLTSQDIAGTNAAYPGSVTNPTPNPTPPPTGDICDGIAPWVSQAYPIGSKVTFRGFLFERTFSGWTNIGRCGTPEPQDICDGVSTYSSNGSYSNGDKVIFQGDLYQAVSGRWTLQGKCGE